jgi:hypothetical protein
LGDATQLEIPNEAKEFWRYVVISKIRRKYSTPKVSAQVLPICFAVVSMRPVVLNHMIGPSSSGKGDQVNPKQMYINPT